MPDRKEKSRRGMEVRCPGGRWRGGLKSHAGGTLGGASFGGLCDSTSACGLSHEAKLEELESRHSTSGAPLNIARQVHAWVTLTRKSARKRAWRTPYASCKG